MENTTKGVIGVLALLAVFGGGIYLTQDQVDNSYYCPSTGEWGIFYGGISSTGLTAYPHAENRSDYVRCTNSKWVLLKDYAAELGIDSDQLINQPVQEPQGSIGVWGQKYACDIKSCMLING